jgi:predicted TIM-barrel fold metal-dependent hydrolase
MLVRDGIAEAFDLKLRDIALPRDRKAQAQGKVKLPPGTCIVSADNHWSVYEDIFTDAFPAHLKHKAPYPVISNPGKPDQFIEWFVEGKGYLPNAVRKTFAVFEGVPGATNLEARMRDLDIEGVQKEIVFGNGIQLFLAFPDIEVREWVFRIYNRHLGEMQKKAPGRFYGVGNINYWDMSKVAESIAELKAQGLKTFLLPINPKGADGVDLNYCAPEMAPLWEAIEAAGLPICFHIGEFYKDGPGGTGTSVMVALGPFRKTLGELIFGGIFDRHPSLQVVFLEADINWVPGALQTASMLYECFPGLLDPVIKRHPREYWATNCYAGFIHDTAGLAMLKTIGADRVMWTQDYPHKESAYGFSWDVIQEILDHTTEDEARMILGGTAQRVFKLD